MWPFSKPKPKIIENPQLLLIEVPQNNDKKPEAAEAMFSALHGILGKEHISFEIVSESKYIRFYVFVPSHLKDFVEGQIYAQYPTVEIKEVEDYTKRIKEGSHFVASELKLTKPDFFPIKTFPNFDVDPLAGITSSLAKMEEGESVWVSVLITPASGEWQSRGISYVQAIKAGRSPTFSFGEAFATFLSDLWRAFSPPTTPSTGTKTEVEIPGPLQAALKGIEEKVTKLGFQTKIRILSISETVEKARARLLAVASSFQQFSTINLNSFETGSISLDDPEVLKTYKERTFDNGYIFNIEELASIFHLPDLSVKTPTIVWARAKKGEPPSNLPIKGEVDEKELTVYAKTNFRHMMQKFGIKLSDRRLHMYLIGKTGTGKTTMLENMVLDDMREGRGLAVVDPHGDFVEFVLNRVPSFRINDLVLFDPSDFEYPIGFNLLERVDPDARNIVASGLIGIFKKIWGDISWGPRLEYILRNTILSLMAFPDSTMLGIMKILVDKKYREKVLSKVADPVLRDFWLTEYEKYDPKFRTEAIAPIQNKVGQFLSSSTIRNIVGQPHSTIDLKEIMDKKKILLVNLPIGKIGEDNSALLGAMMITKIQLTAMERVHLPEEEREDFYLYVDEFQNFATEAFATILSEARKYHLNIILANQYIAQMPEPVRDAIFGNIGTIVSFRIGAQDAPFLVKEFAPVFDENDLVNLDKYNIYIKMAIDGVTCPAFSAITLPPDPNVNKNKEKIIRLSREKYGRPREFVEKKISEWMEEVGGLIIPGPKKIEKEEKPGPKKKEEKIKEARMVSEVYEEFSDLKGRKWYLLKREKEEVKVDPKNLKKEELEEGKIVEFK